MEEDDADLDVIHDEGDPAAEDEHPGADHGGGVEGAGQGGDTGQLGLAPGHRVWWGEGWSCQATGNRKQTHHRKVEVYLRYITCR